MQLRIGVALVAGLTTALAAMTAASAPATARTTPSISMYAVQAKITVGDQPHFGYTTYGLPSGAIVQLQRLTTNGWSTVKEIPRGAHRYTDAPAPGSLGRYQYRIQSVKGATLVARTGVHYIYAYGTVLLRALCGPMQNTCRTQHHPLTIGGQSFYYAMEIGAAAYPNFFAGAHLDRTSCRSITINYAAEHYASEESALKRHQLSGADVETHAEVNEIGHLTASLTGGKFYLDASTTNGGAAGVLMGGYASCYSANGLPPA